MKKAVFNASSASFTAAVFDLDGTVIDSMKDMLICMRAAYRKEGIEVNPGKEHIGPALMDCLKNITPKADSGLLAEVAKNFRADYDNSNYPNTKLYPGIRKLFEKLKAGNIPVYLVTNKRLAPTKRILSKLGLEVFKAVVSPDVREGQTLGKPEMLALLLKQEGLDPKKTVYIGDSVPDVKSAKANGLKTIAVTYGYTAETELKKDGPDYLVQDVAGMSKILLG